MPSLDKELGPFLVATWVETAFYVLILHWAIRYFNHYYTKDRVLLRMLVLAAVTLDTIRTFGDYTLVYLYTVAHWGETDYLRRVPWPRAMSGMCSSAAACLVQNFLVYRFYRFSHNMLVTWILGALTVFTFGSAIATTVSNELPSLANKEMSISVSVSLWLTGSAVTDIAIACSLVWQLRRMQAFVGSTSRTRQLVRQLSAMAIESGCATASIALVALILFFFKGKEGNIPLGVSFAYGPAYSLTMLFNLNNRRRVRMVEVTNLSRLDANVESIEFGGSRRVQTSSGNAVRIREYLGVEDKAGRRLEVLCPLEPEPAITKRRGSELHAGSASRAFQLTKRDLAGSATSHGYEA